MPLHDWTRVDANDYHHFHGSWIFAMTAYLNQGRLPPGFMALGEYTAPPHKPAVLTIRLPGGDQNPVAGGTAVAPAVRFDQSESRRRSRRPVARRVAVRTANGRDLVAVVEIASPGNKDHRDRFRQFRDKVVDLLQSGIHVLVIDPFPPTRRDPNGVHDAIWHTLVGRRFAPPPGEPLTLVSYVAEPGDRFRALVNPTAVGQVLPDMPLFLHPKWPITLPLELTYQSAWAGFPPPLRPLLESPS
jgi:hypothetical protein